MIDTVSSIRGKPDADMYLCVSQRTGKIVALPVADTRDLWRVIQRYDNVRGIDEKFYTCDKQHWRDEDWLRWAISRARKAPRAA